MADPSTYNPIIEQAGKDHNVDPDLIRAILKQESGFNAKAVGPMTKSGRAHGIAQLIPTTAEALGVKDPFDPKQAIPGAAKLLAQNLDQYGNVPDAIAAYHGGTDQSQWGPKTHAYRDKVSAAYSGASTSGGNDDLAALASGGAAKPSQAPEKAKDAPSASSASTDPDLVALASGAATRGPDADVTYKGGAAPVTPAQRDTMNLMNRGHSYDPDAPEGSAKNPLALKDDATVDDLLSQYPDGGVFYIPQAGGLERTPVKGESVADLSTGGLAQGVLDIPQSVLGMFPHAKDKDTKSAYTDLKASQMVYDAAHKGNRVAGAGRLVGQIVGTVPVMAAADAGAATVGLTKLLGPVGTFLAGDAAKVAAPKGAAITEKLIQGGTRLASKSAQGAIQGGEVGALTSSASDKSLGENIKENAMLGAALVPAGAAVKGMARFTGGLTKDLSEPLYQGGREKIADRAIRELAGDGPTTVNASELVPGSRPTLAEATGNTGLGAAERAMKGHPTQGIKFAARERANNDARALAISAMKGDADSLDTLVQARSQAGDTARDAAFAKTVPVDASPVLKVIDDTLASPAGQRDAVANALTNIRAKLAKTVNGAAKVQDDPAQLYGVRQAITDMLDTSGPKTANDARHATSELMKVKTALDGVIESGAPGYKKYLSEFAENSKPVDEQKFLQSLNLGPIDSNGNIVGNVTLGRVNAAVAKIAKMRAEPGVNKAKALSPETMAELGKLQQDLLRQSAAEPVKAVGAHTFQNLATDNLMNRLSGPGGLVVAPHHPIGAMAIGAGKLIYGAQNPKILDTLADKLADPNYGASAFNKLAVKPKASAVKRLAGKAAGRAALNAASSKLLGSTGQ